MSVNRLDPGTLVQLGESGPVMAVSSVVGDLVYCYWYEDDVMRHGSYLVSRLRAAGDDLRTWASPLGSQDDPK